MVNKSWLYILFLPTLPLLGLLIVKNQEPKTKDYFTKNEITESHGSFDERLNLLEERIAIIEDSTKSAISTQESE